MKSASNISSNTATSKEKVYKLKHPIPWAGEIIEEVNVTRPKMKHLRDAEREKEELGKNTTIIAGVTGLEEEVIGEMDAEDFAAVAEIVGRFLQGAKRIGKR